jgi:hypothetical protein
MSYIILMCCWCDIIVLNIHAPAEDRTGDMKDSFYMEKERVFDEFPKQQMKILLENFNAKLSRKDIFKPTIGNESLHEINNDNYSFATSKNLNVKSIMFTYHNINKFNWTSPDGKI